MSYYLYPDHITRNTSTPSKLYNQLLNRTEPNSKPLKCFDKWVSDSLQGLINSDLVMFNTKSLKIADLVYYTDVPIVANVVALRSVALIDYDLVLKLASNIDKTVFVKKLNLYSVDAFAIQYILLDSDKLSNLHRKLFIDDTLETL